MFRIHKSNLGLSTWTYLRYSDSLYGMLKLRILICGLSHFLLQRQLQNNLLLYIYSFCLVAYGGSWGSSHHALSLVNEPVLWKCSCILIESTDFSPCPLPAPRPGTPPQHPTTLTVNLNFQHCTAGWSLKISTCVNP